LGVGGGSVTAESGLVWKNVAGAFVRARRKETETERNGTPDTALALIRALGSGVPTLGTARSGHAAVALGTARQSEVSRVPTLSRVDAAL